MPDGMAGEGLLEPTDVLLGLLDLLLRLEKPQAQGLPVTVPGMVNRAPCPSSLLWGPRAPGPQAPSLVASLSESQTRSEGAALWSLVPVCMVSMHWSSDLLEGAPQSGRAPPGPLVLAQTLAEFVAHLGEELGAYALRVHLPSHKGGAAGPVIGGIGIHHFGIAGVVSITAV